MRLALKEQKHLAFLLLAGTILLLAVPLLRFYAADNTLPGGELHTTLLRVDEIGTDEPVRLVERYGHTPDVYLEYWTEKLLPRGFAIRYLLFALGMITLFTSYFFLKNLKFAEWTIVATLSVLMSSPPFLYVFTSSLYLATMVSFVVVMLLLFSTYQTPISAFVCAVVLLSFGKEAMILAALLFLTILYLKGKNVIYLYGLAGILGISVLYGISPYYEHHMWSALGESLSSKIIFQQTISDMGSLFGYGVFHLVLLFYGVILSWKKKVTFAPFYLIWCILFVFSLLFDSIYLIASIVMGALFMGIGFVGVVSRKWHFSLIKDLTIIIIVCGLFFSSLSFMNRTVDEEPSLELLKAVEELNSVDGRVLTHYSYGSYLNNPFLDSYFREEYNMKERIQSANIIFESRNIQDSLEELRKNDISYILITRSMYEGLIWEEWDEGLLYLLRNEEAFPVVYQNADTQIRAINYQIRIT